MKNKKIRIDTNSARGALYRASTLDDSVEVDEEYDSDFGEEHFDDECVGKLDRFTNNVFTFKRSSFMELHIGSPRQTLLRYSTSIRFTSLLNR